MNSIVEQAKQKPSNATPVGWDAEKICYPGVNTCLTVTTIGRNTSGKAGLIVGMHLGLFMGAGQEGGKGSENSTMIDDAYLGMYLFVLEQQAWVRGGGAERIYISGAIDVWKQNAQNQWRQVTTAVGVWGKKMAAPIDIVAFNDAQHMTVDIYVTRAGVRFTAPGTDTAVGAL